MPPHKKNNGDMEKNVRIMGNALCEYVLPMVVLAGGLAVTLDHSAITDFFKQYLQTELNANIENSGLKVRPLGRISNLQATKMPVTKPAPSNPPTVQPVTSQVPAVTNDAQQVCLQNGICVHLPTVTDSSMAETAGGLGGSLASSFASVLDQTVAQLKAQGADSTLINLITILASNGHSIGDRINYMAPMCGMNAPACDPQNGMKGIQATNGYQTQSGGVTYNHWSTSLDTTSFDNAQKAVAGYFQSHPGQYQDIAAIVNLEAGQISAIATGMTITHIQDDSNPSSGKVNQSTNKAQLVHQDANIICASGGNPGICMQPAG